MHNWLRRIFFLLVCCIVTVLVFVSYPKHPFGTLVFMQSMLLLGVGVYVYAQNRKQPLHRAFLCLCCCSCAYLLLVFFLHIAVSIGIETVKTPVWILRNGLLLLPVAIMHFTHLFLNPQSNWLRYLKWIALFSSLPLVLMNLAGAYVTEYRLLGRTYIPDNALTAYRCSAIIMILWNLVAAGFVLGYAIQEWGSSIRRSQFLLFLGGWGIGFGYAVSGYLPAFKSTFFPSYIGIVWSIFPLAIGVGILKFTLFDIKLVLRRTLPYALGMAVIGCGYILFGGMIGYFFTIPLHSLPGLQFVLLLIVVGISFQPITEALRIALDSLFFRKEAEVSTLLARIGDDFSSCQTHKEVMAETEKIIHETIAPETLAFFFDTGSQKTEEGDLAGLQIETWTDEEWLALFKRPQVGALSELTMSQMGAAVSDFHLYLALHATEFRGIILLGEKKSHLAFSDHDKKILTALGTQIQIAIDRLGDRRMTEKARSLVDALAESAPILIALIDANGKIEESNSRFNAVFSPTENATLPDVGLQSIQTDMEHAQSHDIVVGDRYFLGVKNQVPSSGGDQRELLILTETTELRRTQDLARRQDVLAQIGTMISSINHEMDNILSPISYSLEKITRKKIPPEIETNFERVCNGFKRMRTLINELRQLYKNPALEVREVRLDTIVESVLADLRMIYSEQNSFWKEPLLDDLSIVLQADRQKMRQVIFNLLKNAYESMDLHSPDRVSWGVRVEDMGECSVICIFDCGRGMNEEEQGRLFEPFFSTKGESGTGLGMPIVQRIVEAHGASIHVESALGEGTSICLHWPHRLIINR